MTNEPNDQTARAMRGELGEQIIKRNAVNCCGNHDYCNPGKFVGKCGQVFARQATQDSQVIAVTEDMYLAMWALEPVAEPVYETVIIPDPMLALIGERDVHLAEIAGLKEQARQLTADAHTAVDRAEREGGDRAKLYEYALEDAVKRLVVVDNERDAARDACKQTQKEGDEAVQQLIAEKTVLHNECIALRDALAKAEERAVDRDAWSKLCAEQATELSRLRALDATQVAERQMAANRANVSPCNPFREFGGDRRRVGG